MKNTKFARVISLVFALSLMVCAIIGITASAEEATPDIEIGNVNVAYNEMLHLTFTINGANKAPAGATVGVMTWDADVENPNKDNYTKKYSIATERDNTTYYKTGGVAATEIDDVIVVAAYYDYNGETVVCETPFAYSIIKYLGTRLTEDKLTLAQADLYAKLIKYAVASNKILDAEGNPNYAFVKAVNGYVGNHGQSIGGWAGKEVLLRAEAKNADGEYFLGWKNEEGVIVSENRLFWVNCPEAGIDTYTAIFGDKDSSMYKNTVNLESMNSFPADTTQDGLYANMKTSLGSFSIGYDPITGDKELHLNRTATGGGYFFYNTKGVSGSVGCELDITRYNLKTASTSIEHFTISMDKKGTTTAVTARIINFYYNANAKSIRIDLGGNGDDKTLLTFTPEIGETYTFGMSFQKKSTTTVDEATGEETITYGVDFTFYFNGKAIATVDAMKIKNFKDIAANVDLENFYIDQYALTGYNAAADNISIDNYTTFSEYKN